ncbi:MAG: hypothetical protein BYD32DRAFT_101431 [Podila humilis]|nr:MAG: hypothetical protein BYD32DRAFT_101431 [Podila humilis]
MTEDPQAIWLERYMSTQGLERKLKEMLHQKGSTGVTDARDRLREEYERLILTDIILAQSKDIEHALWKNVFYIVIDGYRRKLASLTQNEKTQAPQQNNSKRGNGNSGQNQGRNNNGNRGNKKPVPSMDYRKVSTKFRAFIQEATGFYHRLIQNLASCYDLNEMGAVGDVQSISVGYRHTMEISDNARQAAISSCHKCYIFLGDLARYRQTYSDSPKKNWSAARDYYNEARNLLPTSGNPYNQLAVIATLAPNNFLALYFYYRSLAVRLPFMTARKNIAVLIQKLSTDPEKGKKFIREERYNDRNSLATKDSTQLSNFLAKFVLMHGTLFMRSVEELDQDLMRVSLERLFLDRQIDPELLLKIQIVNMSSLYTMCYIPAQDDSPAVSPEHQIAYERQALQLITNAFATILRHATMELEQHRNGEHKVNGRPADFLPSNVHRSMPTLRLSLKWLQVNIHHVKRLSEGSLDQEKDRLLLDQIWSDLAVFLTLLSEVYPFSNDTIFCRDVLKEDAELQGFAALKRAIDERPLSIIPPSRISPKAEMQMRVADMFYDALSITKLDWVRFYGKTLGRSEPNQRLVFSTDRDEIGSSDTDTSSRHSDVTEEELDGTDNEQGSRQAPVPTFAYKASQRFIPPTEDGQDDDTEDPLDQDIDQRQAVAALLSDDDNDLSLIVGGDDDDDEEEEVVLFTGRNSTISGKPTPRPAHLKTKTGVIGGGRRSSNSPPGSNQSSPGVDSESLSRDESFFKMTTSPTVDSVFGGFQFGASDDWRHSINSLRTSRTESSLSHANGTINTSTWGGVSTSALGNGLISPGTYETRRATLNSFSSMPTSRSGPPGIPFPTNASTDLSGFHEEPFFQPEAQGGGQGQQPYNVFPLMQPQQAQSPSRSSFLYQAQQHNNKSHMQQGRNSVQPAPRDQDWR